MSEVKSINSLMKYLRDTHNIDIAGSTHKTNLRNLGYYHGFKGYRFVRQPQNRLNFSHFNQVIAINKFDMDLKALLYPKIMFLETAIKNYVLEIVIQESNTNNFNKIFETLLTGYRNHSVGSRQYKSAMEKRLRLRQQIYNTLSRDYSNKQVVNHFYDNNLQVPIWAIFEIITLGEFGTFISCLNTNCKIKLSHLLNFNSAYDAHGKLTELIVFVLKDLRNSVAHNSPIFDVRFRTQNINGNLVSCLSNDTHITNIRFNSIVDYIILIVYLKKKLSCSKTEINKFIRDFELIINEFRCKVPTSIYTTILFTDTRSKINLLKTYVTE